MERWSSPTRIRLAKENRYQLPRVDLSYSRLSFRVRVAGGEEEGFSGGGEWPVECDSVSGHDRGI